MNAKTRGALTAISFGTGAAYLTWRFVGSRGSTPGLLWWSALVVEALGVVGTMVVLWALRARGAHVEGARGEAAVSPSADVVVRADHAPLSLVLATLAGVRHVRGVASVTVLHDADFEGLAALASRGVSVVRMNSSDRAGLVAGLDAGAAPLIAVLDAGDVPMPHFVESVCARLRPSTAAVQARVDTWTNESAEHDGSGRHTRTFERETLNVRTGGRGNAVVDGSGAVYVRSKLEQVDVPRGARRSVEYRLSARLHAAGHAVEAHDGAVLVSEAAPNGAQAVHLLRRRETAAALRLLISADSPLWARSRGLSSHLDVLASLVRPLSGVRRALFLLVLVGALLSSTLPFRPDAVALAALWLPMFVSRSVALRFASDGRLPFGESTRWSMRSMGAGVAAFAGPGRRSPSAFALDPRAGGMRGIGDQPALAAALVGVAASVLVVAASDRWTSWLPETSPAAQAGALAVAGWTIGAMLDSMRMLAGRRQLRRVMRIPTEIEAAVGPTEGTIIDLSSHGAAAVTAIALDLDSVVATVFFVPTVDGDARALVSASAVVRSSRPTSAGFVHGLEFCQMDDASSDRLYDFCTVAHATSVFRALATAPSGASEARGRSIETSAPRRPVVRIAAVLGLAGIAATTAPPYAVSLAAPKPAGGRITVDVFRDLDANGERDTAANAGTATDALIAGVTLSAVCLVDNGTDAVDGTGDLETYSAPVSPTSSSGGRYTFADLPGTPCRVEATSLPAGFRPAPIGSGNAGLTQFADSGSTVAMGIMKSAEAPIAVGNRVWFDANGNGLQDPGEAPVAGVDVTLTIGAETFTATTDLHGGYLFSSGAIPQLVDGATAVVAFPTSVVVGGRTVGLTSTGGGSATADSNPEFVSAESTITLSAGRNDHTIDAGYAPAHTLGNLVWDDLDNDGLRGPDETGLDGVRVTLYRDIDGNGVPDGAAVANQTTSSGGHYLFSGLSAGTYIVEATMPAGYRSSSGARRAPIGPYEGATTPDADAVATDGDDNGSAGDDRPMTVRSKPVSLGSSEPTGEPSTPGHTDLAVDGRSNLTVDLGFFRHTSTANLAATATPTATVTADELAGLGDHVWCDRDRNGDQDPGEEPVGNVTVILFDTVGFEVSRTATDANGDYEFVGLEPGAYAVQFVVPTGFVFTDRNQSSSAGDSDANLVTGQTTRIELESGELDRTVDAGLYQLASIGDQVWDDADGDGAQSSGDRGVADVTVTLYDASDNVAASTTTDENGMYRFSALMPGEYRLGFFNLPSGAAITGRDGHTDDSMDSDLDPTTGRTTMTVLEAGEIDLTWDVGIRRPDPLQLASASASADAVSLNFAPFAPPTLPPDDTVSSPTLPVTGANAVQLLVFALTLMVIGLAVMPVVGRRRPKHA